MAKLNPVLLDYLTDWGKMRRAGVSGLGYPTSTTEWRQFYSPGRSTKPQEGPQYERRAKGSAVERVLRIWAADGRVRFNLVLWCRWVQDMNIDRGRRAMGCSNVEYESLLKDAQEELAEALQIRCYDTRKHRTGWAITDAVGELRKKIKQTLLTGAG